MTQVSMEDKGGMILRGRVRTRRPASKKAVSQPHIAHPSPAPDSRDRDVDVCTHLSCLPRTASVEAALRNAPPWNYANTFLCRGFRAASDNTWHSLWTGFFGWHNESVNIYVHVLASVWFVLRTPSVLEELGEKASRADVFFFVFFMGATALCFAVSGLYHALANHSEKVHHCLLQWDLRCITVLIASCYFPVMTNAFHCHPYLSHTFNLLVLLSAALVLYLPTLEWFHRPQAMSIRLAVYAFLGGFGIVPCVVAYFLKGHDAAVDTVLGVGAVYAFFALGCGFYLVRFPECVAARFRNWRGMFDLVGASHQIWHVFVVLGVVRHLQLCLEIHARRVAEGCPA